MTRLGQQLRAHFEETVRPIAIEEILSQGAPVVGDEGGTGTSSDSPGRLPWWHGPARAAAVAVVVVSVFVGIASMLGGSSEVTGIDSAEAARAAIEDLYGALEDQDIEAIEAFFGESVAFNSYLGIDMIGPEAAAYHIRTIMVPMTVRDVGEPVQNDDGSFSLVVEVLADTHRVPWEELYHIVMDGTRVVSVDHDGNIAAAPREDVFAPYLDP